MNDFGVYLRFRIFSREIISFVYRTVDGQEEGRSKREKETHVAKESQQDPNQDCVPISILP